MSRYVEDGEVCYHQPRRMLNFNRSSFPRFLSNGMTGFKSARWRRSEKRRLRRTAFIDVNQRPVFRSYVWSEACRGVP